MPLSSASSSISERLCIQTDCADATEGRARANAKAANFFMGASIIFCLFRFDLLIRKHRNYKINIKDARQVLYLVV